MKILHSTNVYDAELGGGIHEVVINLSHAQKVGGCSTSIIFPERSTGQADDKNGIVKTPIPHPVYAPRRFIRAMTPLLNDIQSEIDVVHQHGVWTYMSSVALAVSLRSSVPLIIQSHGLLEPFKFSKSRLKKKLALHTYERTSVARAAVLVACSMREGETLRELFPKKPIAVIPNGVSDIFFSPTKEPKLAQRPAKKQLLFFSQLIPIKGVERLINSIELLGDVFSESWELEIAGYGDFEYRESLIKLVKDKNLTSAIKFSGPAYGGDRLIKFDQSDAFVLPTFDENFGIVIAEALARAKPVVTTTGAPWQCLAEVGAGFWAENSEEGIKEAIKSLVSLSDEELKIMGHNGREYISKQYSWELIARKYYELYEFSLGFRDAPSFLL